jgi:muramoyltetrapeptide carboxypeptidase
LILAKLLQIGAKVRYCAMFRRTFIGKSLATASALSVGLGSLAGPMGHKARKKLIKPKILRQGATVALLAPSSPPAEAKIDKALLNLKTLGFKVIEGKHLRHKHGYLAGTDADRVADLHQAFADPTIEAIWCVRGGYGCTRILHLLDYDLIRKNPKPLIGYSDITALHVALYQEAGLVSFHGQVAGGDMTEFTLRHIDATLMEVRKSAFAVPAFYQNMRPTDEFNPYVITEGKAHGPLIGGNLTVLAATLGTEQAPRFKDHIVFLEEIGEAPYRVDRLLTQLLNGSDLCDAKGIALGIFTDCVQKSDTSTFTTPECLRERLGGLGIPVYYGAPFGHISDQCVLPYGIPASIDSGKMELTLLESGVL